MAPMDPPPKASPVEQLLALLQDPANLVAVIVALGALVLVQVYLFSSVAKRKSRKPFLDPNAFKALPLVEKTMITHNTAFMKFELPEKDQRVGLPVGLHISFMAKDADGKDVYRSYTPVSDDDQLGSVDFVIKIYPQGKMSQILAKMEVGDSMLMKGPKGRLQYSPNMKKHIGMLAGGTGVTPMFQVINAVLSNPADRTKLTLLFGNLTHEDILLKPQLDALAQQHPDRFKLHYVLNTAPEGVEWTGSIGFITKDLIKEHLAAPADDVMVLRCGPTPMMDAMKKSLAELGYAEEAQFQF